MSAPVNGADEREPVRCTAADGKTEVFNIPGYPLMVRAVDFNAALGAAQVPADLDHYALSDLLPKDVSWFQPLTPEIIRCVVSRIRASDASAVYVDPKIVASDARALAEQVHYQSLTGSAT